MPICANVATPSVALSVGRAVLVMVMISTLVACASVSKQPESQTVSPGASAESEQAQWRYVRFRLAWADGEEVSSHLDLLIADQVLAPVIARYAKDIELWRFHRRWASDATGHQFSFIFYAPGSVAEHVIGQIEENPLLADLRLDGHLAELRVDAAAPDSATDPAATSDTSWTPEIQREWPKFIMGASRMWLGLVRSEAVKHAELELYERYLAAEAALDAQWLNQGNHAFFHHLSALFGYKPVRVIRRDIMTF